MKSSFKMAAMWNTAAGMINAGQSAIILIFISRQLGAEVAGIFTIAYALANLFATIGKYGVRNYQVTDLEEKGKFSEYLLLRIITMGIALFIMVIYIMIQFCQGNYDCEKIVVVILMTLWKFVDVIEDVFYGMYQQYNRLDLGSKCYCIRLLLSSILYCVLICAGSSLVIATFFTVILSVLIASVMICGTWKKFNVSLLGARFISVRNLFIECLPLCIGTSLSIYVGNIPKYLIDAYMDETIQAYFGFLMMPAFVILMLSSFVYQPLVRNFGEMWRNHEKQRIMKYIGSICSIIFMFTVCVVIVGMWIGLPILSWLYSVDLTMFKREFLILLLGGGIYALVSFLLIPLTSIREQRNIAIGFLIVSVLSSISGGLIVRKFGMVGAAVLYLVQNILLVFYFFCCFLKRIRETER